MLLYIYANLWLKIPKFRGGSKKFDNFLTFQKRPISDLFKNPNQGV